MAEVMVEAVMAAEAMEAVGMEAAATAEGMEAAAARMAAGPSTCCPSRSWGRGAGLNYLFVHGSTLQAVIGALAVSQSWDHLYTGCMSSKAALVLTIRSASAGVIVAHVRIILWAYGNALVRGVVAAARAAVPAVCDHVAVAAIPAFEQIICSSVFTAPFATVIHRWWRFWRRRWRGWRLRDNPGDHDAQRH